MDHQLFYYRRYFVFQHHKIAANGRPLWRYPATLPRY